MMFDLLAGVAFLTGAAWFSSQAYSGAVTGWSDDSGPMVNRDEWPTMFWFNIVWNVAMALVCAAMLFAVILR